MITRGRGRGIVIATGGATELGKIAGEIGKQSASQPPLLIRMERFARLIVMNTTLATGQSPGPGFEAWKAYAKANPDMDVGALMHRATPILTEGEVAAYNAPFPDQRYKAGVRRFPQMVMVSPEMEGADVSRQAAAWWSQSWSGPTFMAVGMKDPEKVSGIARTGDRALIATSAMIGIG
jgi:hypothetical protein